MGKTYLYVRKEMVVKRSSIPPKKFEEEIIKFSNDVEVPKEQL